MKKETPISLRHLRRITAILFLCPISLSSIQASAASDQSDVSSASVHQEQTSGILRAEKINPTTVDVLFANQQRMTIDFYGENIFRVFQDNSGGIIRDPEAKPEAQILVDQPRRKVSGLSVDEKDGYITLTTAQVRIELNKQTGLMKVFNPLTGKCVIEEVAPVIFGPKEVTVTLKENPEEYFYGGGVQNGRFSHKGKVIAIENQNSWTDGGVASPAPFYWSTNGYGMMWYTFRKGEYDFGATEKNIVKLSHNSSYLDIFYMVNDGVVSLLNDFYQLTGNPVLLPKFGFYEGHLNAYNRDYWKEDEKGILFEDGKRYKESQKDNGGIKESLNGEKNNYQFSARAVIDRYKNHDIEVVIDKLIVAEKDDKRLKQSVATAMRQGDGLLMILDAQTESVRHYSKRLMCPVTGLSYREPAPHNFSFNSPQGACPNCKGLVVVNQIDVDKVIPDLELSIYEGAIAPLGKYKNAMIFWQIGALLEKYEATLKTPVKELSDDAVEEILYGSDDRIKIKSSLIGTSSDYFVTYEGVVKYIQMLQEKDASATAQKWAEQFARTTVCPECKGARLNKEALHFRIHDKNINDLANMDINELYDWLMNVDQFLSDKQKKIAAEILKEIRTRLKFLLDVGLDY